MSTQALHAAEQAELTNPRPYETRLRERILRIVKQQPTATKKGIQNRLGFVVGNLFETTFAQLIEDGIIREVLRTQLAGYVVNEEAQ